MVWGKRHINVTTYRAGMLQSQANRALTGFMNDALKPHGISIPGWAVLGGLYDAGQMRMSELAASLGVKPPVATSLVRDLEARGLLERRTPEDDNRVTVLSLNGTGKSLVESLERTIRLSMRDYLSDISITELLVYMRVLNKLAAKL